jgi:hypothetical protein
MSIDATAGGTPYSSRSWSSGTVVACQKSQSGATTSTVVAAPRLQAVQVPEARYVLAHDARRGLRDFVSGHGGEDVDV